MLLSNIKDSSQKVSFSQAVEQPIGNNKGLFFPRRIEPLSSDIFKIDNFQELSYQVLQGLIGPEIPSYQLRNLVEKAFNFPLKLKDINHNDSVLELFHGPTFAFKDFGARFLAQCLHYFKQQQATTILTATSGDTGAAVAHAFYKMDNIKVVILYPKGKISPEQEQLFCTLGHNINCIAVEGDFDLCQAMVKQCFADPLITNKHQLSSANSINIARLFAQVCYYAALPSLHKKKIDYVSVPSGNFGNLTAGLIAKQLGAPIGQLIAATNSNDTVVRYLASKLWQPKPTQPTLSNAMDVAEPNNYARIEYLTAKFIPNSKPPFSAIAVNEQQTIAAIEQLSHQSYIADPHTAVAYSALQTIKAKNQNGIFLSTAHPAKFSQAIEQATGQQVALPPVMQQAMQQTNLSITISSEFSELKSYLLEQV